MNNYDDGKYCDDDFGKVDWAEVAKEYNRKEQVQERLWRRLEQARLEQERLERARVPVLDKSERDKKPLGTAQGDFYSCKSNKWWRCPSDDKLHVFKWEKGNGTELLVNWKGESWLCRRSGAAGLGDILYHLANESNWLGVYVTGEDRFEEKKPLRNAGIAPPAPPPVNTYAGDVCYGQVWNYSNAVQGRPGAGY